MNKKKALLMGAMATLALGAGPLAAEAKVKCKGVALAGSNGCGANGHGCGGKAATHFDKNEWIKLKDEKTCNEVKKLLTTNPALKAWVAASKKEHAAH